MAPGVPVVHVVRVGVVLDAVGTVLLLPHEPGHMVGHGAVPVVHEPRREATTGVEFATGPAPQRAAREALARAGGTVQIIDFAVLRSLDHAVPADGLRQTRRESGLTRRKTLLGRRLGGGPPECGRHEPADHHQRTQQRCSLHRLVLPGLHARAHHGFGSPAGPRFIDALPTAGLHSPADVLVTTAVPSPRGMNSSPRDSAMRSHLLLDGYPPSPSLEKYRAQPTKVLGVPREYSGGFR